MGSFLDIFLSFFITLNLICFCILPYFYIRIRYALAELQVQGGIKVRQLLKIPFMLLLLPFLSIVFVILTIEVISENISENKKFKGLLDKDVISFNKDRKSDYKCDYID